jgi:hypothetical protein
MCHRWTRISLRSATISGRRSQRAPATFRVAVPDIPKGARDFEIG